MGELHFVCTREEAKEIIEKVGRFWVEDCDCRLKKGECERSRLDLCLLFTDNITVSGVGLKEITEMDVEDIFREAEEKNLVTRPFHMSPDVNKISGICFCCDDCCEFFLREDIECDKGKFIENTDMDVCNHCGLCVNVCYFGAREMGGDELKIDRDLCYGCGLCLDVCPERCIEMICRD